MFDSSSLRNPRSESDNSAGFAVPIPDTLPALHSTASQISLRQHCLIATRNDMSISDAQPESLTFAGAMKAGSFTAQLGVQLHATPSAITLTAFARSYQLDRENFDGLEKTAILGIFKRGVSFLHRQDDLPSQLVFYPSVHRDDFLEQIEHLGWS